MLETRDLDAPLHRAPTQPRTAPASQPPAFAGRFEIRGELGRGGMSVVYRAWDPQVGREVALKILSGSDPDQVERLRREGRVAGRLDHPGVLKVHASGVAGGRPYLVYELVEGCRTLDVELASLERAARIERVAQVAEVLGCAHAAGVVHRDVKPSNVLVGDDGRIRVADFGLAFVADEARLTRSGTSLGTPHCMAPEQVQGDRDAQGPATDVWGLGVLLYLALTDTLPFDGSSMSELANRILHARCEAPRSLDPTVPEGLQRVCLRALDRDPRERFPDGAAFAVALHDPSRVSSQGRRRRWRRLAAALVPALALITLLTTAATYDPSPSPPRAAATAELAAPVGPARAIPPRHTEIESTAQLDEGQVQTNVNEWLVEGSAMTAEALELRADLRYGGGDLLGSFADYTRLIELQPKEPRHLLARAVVAVELDRVAVGIEDMEAAARLSGELEDELQLAGFYVRGGRLAEGAALLRKIQADPRLDEAQHFEARYLMGRVLFRRGESEAGLRETDAALAGLRAVGAKPPASAHADRGEMLLQLGREDEALAALNRAAEEHPNQVLGRVTRARLYEQRGAFELALQDLAWVIERRPGTVVYLSQRAVVLARLGRYDQALTDASKAIELQPDNALTWALRGGLRRIAFDARGSLHDLNQAFELNPTDVNVLLQRAKTHVSLGQRREAQNDALRALELQPTSAAAAQLLRELAPSSG